MFKGDKMKRIAMSAAVAALAVAVGPQALAADLYEPIVEAAPVAPADPVYVEPAPATAGWYIRGDIGGRWSKFEGADYITYGPPPGTDILEGKLKGSFSLGGGVGVQVTDHFRTDLTADYWFKSDFNGSSSGGATVDVSSMSALLLLANAYVDVGTWHGITPYVGAGIGGAHVDWGTLTNTPPGAEHPGSKNWRFAAAVMAGASYCVTNNLKLDAGYRFAHVRGGRMFEQVGAEPGPGFDRSFNTHEVRAGLRYQFGGGSNGCREPEPVAYVPPAVEPVYK